MGLPSPGAPCASDAGSDVATLRAFTKWPSPRCLLKTLSRGSLAYSLRLGRNPNPMFARDPNTAFPSAFRLPVPKFPQYASLAQWKYRDVSTRPFIGTCPRDARTASTFKSLSLVFRKEEFSVRARHEGGERSSVLCTCT